MFGKKITSVLNRLKAWESFYGVVNILIHIKVAVQSNSQCHMPIRDFRNVLCFYQDVFYLTVAHDVSCFLGGSPTAHQRTAVNPAHASVLLSSSTQGRSRALYLTRPARCFPDMPSRFHHSALLGTTVQFLISTEIYFHTSKRYIPLKKKQKKN